MNDLSCPMPDPYFCKKAFKYHLGDLRKKNQNKLGGKRKKDL
jgi:hypothetical protein